LFENKEAKNFIHWHTGGCAPMDKVFCALFFKKAPLPSE
jgi:hypothetical protein